MKELPIGIQTFEKIRTDNFLYVDKTKFIFKIITQYNYAFIARPRRFGKSLLITTLKAYFEGRKDLFKGLYIYQKSANWKVYPIIHIDYSLINYKDGKAIFETSLLNQLYGIGKKYGIKLQKKIIGDSFQELVIGLYHKFGSVVVLVDEYDKPLVDTIGEDVNFNENRAILKELYGIIKGLDSYLHFVFLTGVSRFAKVSVFSGMNNLSDLSLSEEFADVIGFTEADLLHYFSDWLEKLSDKFQLEKAALMTHIREWYNGYSFDGINKLYNPFSILNLCKNLDFSNYWFSTGTPTFLIELIKIQRYLPETFEDMVVSDLIGSTVNLTKYPVLPLLFQTGYLTIKKIERDGLRKLFHLDYPNEEVRYSFLNYLAAAFMEKAQFEIEPEALEMRRALKAGNTDKFVTHLQSFLGDIPARLHIPKEAYYHSMIYMLLRLVGVQLLLEKETSKGRIDAVLELSDIIYVMEFKFATNKRVKKVQTLANQAIRQIEAKKYYEPYLNSSKKLLLLGVGILNKQVGSKVKILLK